MVRIYMHTAGRAALARTATVVFLILAAAVDAARPDSIADEQSGAVLRDEQREFWNHTMRRYRNHPKGGVIDPAEEQHDEDHAAAQFFLNYEVVSLSLYSGGPERLSDHLSIFEKDPQRSETVPDEFQLFQTWHVHKFMVLRAVAAVKSRGCCQGLEDHVDSPVNEVWIVIDTAGPTYDGHRVYSQLDGWKSHWPHEADKLEKLAEGVWEQIPFVLKARHVGLVPVSVFGSESEFLAEMRHRYSGGASAVVATRPRPVAGGRGGTRTERTEKSETTCFARWCRGSGQGRRASEEHQDDAAQQVDSEHLFPLYLTHEIRFFDAARGSLKRGDPATLTGRTLTARRALQILNDHVLENFRYSRVHELPARTMAYRHWFDTCEKCVQRCGSISSPAASSRTTSAERRKEFVRRRLLLSSSVHPEGAADADKKGTTCLPENCEGFWHCRTLYFLWADALRDEVVDEGQDLQTSCSGVRRVHPGFCRSNMCTTKGWIVQRLAVKAASSVSCASGCLSFLAPRTAELLKTEEAREKYKTAGLRCYHMAKHEWPAPLSYLP